jgi:aminoglycoside phosphotransferase (APT) family kinase protein
VKAVSSEPNPTSPAYHRREARIVGALPATAPVPRLLWTYDDGDWVLLVFEDVAGTHPAEPWRDDELARVLAAMAELAALLTPSPIRTRTAGDLLARDICSWRRLLAAPPEALDPWSRRHLPRLAELDARAPAAIAGDTLVHFDIRGDNVLLAADRVIVLDWPHASIGAAWADLVFFAPSVAMQGGPAPAELGRRYPPIAAADDDVDAVAGFFTARALEPPPPGLPTLRPFQAAQAEVARAWLAERLHLG